MELRLKTDPAREPSLKACPQVKVMKGVKIKVYGIAQPQEVTRVKGQQSRGFNPFMPRTRKF